MAMEAPNSSMPPALRAELERLIAQGQTIAAIKRYHRATGVGLKEAKEAIEAMPRGTEAGAAVVTLLRARGISIASAIRLLAVFFWLCAMLAALAAAWQSYERSVVAHRWPIVDAEVERCRIDEVTSRRSAPFSVLACRFRYRVAGSDYAATTRSSGIPSAAQEAAMREWVELHPAGASQAIHYDPADPKTISLGDADQAFQADTPQHRLRLAGFFTGAGALAYAVSAWLIARRQIIR